MPTDLASIVNPNLQASDADKVRLVQFLTEKYTGPAKALLEDTRDGEDMASLHHACRSGSVKLAYWLVEKCPGLKCFLPVQKNYVIKLIIEDKKDEIKQKARKAGPNVNGYERATKRLNEVLKWLDKSVAPSISVGSYIEPIKAGSEQVRLLTKHLSLGSLFVGMPGAGKTIGMKKMVEELALLSSMRHIIILDVKGDWSQMIDKNPKAEEDRFKVRGVDTRVFTFGTEHGWKATLDPFVAFDESKPVSEMTMDEKCDLHGRLRLFVKDGAWSPRQLPRPVFPAHGMCMCYACA